MLDGQQMCRGGGGGLEAPQTQACVSREGPRVHVRRGAVGAGVGGEWPGEGVSLHGLKGSVGTAGRGAWFFQRPSEYSS